MLSKIKRYLGFLHKCFENFYKGNFTFSLQFFYRVHIEIAQKILGIKYQKKLIKTHIGGNEFTIYNSLVSYLIIDEIWSEKLYSRFEGCKYILDLGGYLGESAVFFNKYIKAKVDVYEPDKRNFEVLEKNCEKKHGISCFKGAVVSGNKEYMIIYDNVDRGSISQNSGEKVKTYDFFEIIKKNKYDGLKIDIEGGEYEILDSLIVSKQSIERKTIFLEFHDLKNKKTKTKVINYIKYFINNGYVFEIIDNNNQPVQFINIMEYESDFINIIFKKI